MKLLLLVSVFALILVCCKSGPDQALVKNMQDDIAKYEPQMPLLQQFSSEMTEMGTIMLALPEDIKAKVPKYNTEEAQTWVAVGSKMHRGLEVYSKKLDALKNLSADYSAGLMPKDSAEALLNGLRANLTTMPNIDILTAELKSAKGSYQQMTASIPDSILISLKEKVLPKNQEETKVEEKEQ